MDSNTPKRCLFVGSFATIGISRTYVDNSDLEFSLIGRMECTEPGSRAATVEPFLVGIPSTYGYTRDNCQTSKDEILARELLNCTFNPLSPGSEQCSPIKSATFQKSFLSSGATSSNRLQTVSMTQAVKDKYDAICPQDCIQDSYTISPSYSPISDSLKADIQKKIPANGQNTNVIVLKFFLNSMEYQRIHNFPQHGMQFVAEVGGLMAFFLGISVISIIECLCYGLNCCWSMCCGRCASDDVEDDRAREDLPPPKWRSNKPNEAATRESYYWINQNLAMVYYEISMLKTFTAPVSSCSTCSPKVHEFTKKLLHHCKLCILFYAYLN